jgi:hypothetical protein
MRLKWRHEQLKMMQTLSCFTAFLEAIEVSNISGFFYSPKEEKGGG